MASHKSNFMLVTLIVFYSITNFDKAFCFSYQECEINMKLYCGEDLRDILKCAKRATAFFNPRSTPHIPKVENFCCSEDLLPDEELITHISELDYIFPMIAVERDIQQKCILRLEMILSEYSVNDIFIKNSISIDIQIEMASENTYINKYLKVFARDITVDEDRPGNRKTPEDFCDDL